MTARSKSTYPRSRQQLGMTLVEVLVTLVSTSVGLLGIAALQLVSLRSNQDMHVRLQASTLAASMLERIRTNPDGFHSDDYGIVPFNATEAASKRAAADLVAWQSDIDRLLPGGPERAAGAIHTSPSANTVTVTIRWGSATGAANAPSTPISTLQMQTEM